MADSIILNQVVPLGTHPPLRLFSINGSLVELLDKSIGSRLWIIMRNKKEFVGTLSGFDDFVSKLTCSLTRLHSSFIHSFIVALPAFRYGLD